MVNSKRTIIMHMSDMHFGIPEKRQNASDRKNVQNTFIKSYAELIRTHPNWAPDILVISGDIAWSASDDDYHEAENFFKEFFLVNGNKISPSQVIACFGNHDTYADPYLSIVPDISNMAFDKKMDKHIRRPSRELEPDVSKRALDCEEALLIEDVERYYHRFENAEKFCDNMGFLSLNNSSSNKMYKHAYGSCSVNGVDFICLNTEWDFWGSKDRDAKGHLRIGLKTYQDANRQFAYQFLPFRCGMPPRFVVFHRDLKHLHKMEQFSPNLFEFDKCVGNLIRHNDVSLNGHEHIHSIERYGAHTRIQAGTLHSTDYFEYTCNLISIPQKLIPGLNDCEVRRFSYSPSHIYDPWQIESSDFAEHFYIARLADHSKVSALLNAIDNIDENIEVIENICSNLTDEERYVLTAILSDKTFHEILEFVKGRKQTESAIESSNQDYASISSGTADIIADSPMEGSAEVGPERGHEKEPTLIKVLTPDSFHEKAVPSENSIISNNDVKQ